MCDLEFVLFSYCERYMIVVYFGFGYLCLSCSLVLVRKDFKYGCNNYLL